MNLPANPNGLCWCDCGEDAAPGKFFQQGHDKRADRYLVAVEGGRSIAERLAALGYVPGEGHSLRDAVLAADDSYEVCGLIGPDGKQCRIIGRGAGMRNHRAAGDRHSD